MRITYEHELEELNKCLRGYGYDGGKKAIEQTFVAFEDQIIPWQRTLLKETGM